MELGIFNSQEISYSVNSFVCAQPERSDDPLDFWIVQIINAHKIRSSFFTDISLHWYECF